MAVGRMCAACQARHDAWLDYRLPAGVKIASGSTRDDTVAGVADTRAARFQEWRDTINRQQKMIRDQCIGRHGGHRADHSTRDCRKA